MVTPLSGPDVYRAILRCDFQTPTRRDSLTSGRGATAIARRRKSSINVWLARLVKPGPPPAFNNRPESDRFQPGTKATWIRNATIWTGRVQGLEVINGDLFLDRGLIKAVGHVDPSLLDDHEDTLIVDAAGAWVTPGIVDLHSHIAVEPQPGLQGARDGNSFKGPVLPWLRSIDGINTRDDSYRHSVAGGVTTSLILPGSANAIGGQAFVIKLRPTAERSPTSLLLEPPFGLNGSEVDPSLPPRWRHIKHACGENPARVYSDTRMDTTWAFRQAYNKAQQIKEAQDEYCEKALSGQWNSVRAKFPEDLQWEALVDVLRGRVKVQTHCYEAVDIDNFVRIANEFQFPVAAFHHAHEAYLVPEVLKKAPEHAPAIAMFASFSRYKREAYRHSEFAPRILADSGIKVVMKSDHPAINSRYLLHEAQQAHYYGLPGNVALSSVITAPAEVLGLEHRIGKIKAGYDADIVLWDSHPLALGATPTQVFIDGIAQIESPHVVDKVFQLAPITPNFDAEAAETLKYDGLPPLFPKPSTTDLVLFTNVSNIWRRSDEGVSLVFAAQGTPGIVAVENGKIICMGEMHQSCLSFVSRREAAIVDLGGGGLSPALVSFGSQLGLQEIAMEASTIDGTVYDPLTDANPALLGKEGTLVRAVDGLQFGTRNALLAYRGGVTEAIVSPANEGFASGLSTAFSLGSAHKLVRGSIVQEVVAVHVSIGHRGVVPSVSTQITALRRLLLEDASGQIGYWFKQVSQGTIPLIVEVKNADIMATLLSLKEEVETFTGVAMKMSFLGATEAHLLAPEIGRPGVGVLLSPPRPFPYTWEQRRILPGPPLTADSALARLVTHNVTVGIGSEGVEGEASLNGWAVRNLRFDAAWVRRR